VVITATHFSCLSIKISSATKQRNQKMQQLNNNQYFLLLPELNLCPEIKTNTIEMIEQIMNAHVLLNKNNIQQGINNILELEYYCKPFLFDNYVAVLEQITPLLNNFSIYVAQGEQVRGMYSKYHNKSKNYSDVGKQAAINLEFALEKKLSYDGRNITWEDTSRDFVDKLIRQQDEVSQYNTADRLVYNNIHPKTLNSRLDIRDIILEEIERHVEEYRKKLQLERASIL